MSVKEKETNEKMALLDDDEWDAFKYDEWMRRALSDNKQKKKFATINDLSAGELEEELIYYKAHTYGSDRALRERLFRAMYRNEVGTEGVPWFENSDFLILDRRRKGSRTSDKEVAEQKKKEEKAKVEVSQDSTVPQIMVQPPEPLKMMDGSHGAVKKPVTTHQTNLDMQQMASGLTYMSYEAYKGALQWPSQLVQIQGQGDIEASNRGDRGRPSTIKKKIDPKLKKKMDVDLLRKIYASPNRSPPPVWWNEVDASQLKIDDKRKNEKEKSLTSESEDCSMNDSIVREKKKIKIKIRSLPNS